MHRCPQRDQDSSNLCWLAGKAGTMRSVHVSRDFLDDKQTGLPSVPMIMRQIARAGLGLG
jgi:hypothetical protein